MTTDHPSIGFAAAGQLRSTMVTRLLNEGFTVGVWNRLPTTLETLADPGKPVPVSTTTPDLTHHVDWRRLALFRAISIRFEVI